jgi:hypothetical protein
MRIMTAHKILISTAAVFFVFYGGWELMRYFKTGEFWAFPRGLAALLVAAVLGVYFAYLRRKGTIAAVADGLKIPRRSP